MGLLTSCIGTAFLYTLLMERYSKGKKGQEDEEEDVSSHWMNINEREDTRN